MEPIRILLVDDDPSVTSLLAAKLGKSEQLLVKATNRPEHAIAIASQFQPHIVICDIDMDKTDGGWVADQLAKETTTARIPILFLSSLVTREQVEQAGGVIGGRQMMSKNCKINELVARIKAVLSDPA